MILPITGKVGDFVDGEVVTGQTSGAKGIVATHFLRCQDLVNPSNVAIPVKFKAVFEPAGAGLPPASKGIALTGVEGTFQDGETVVGGTSGAYASAFIWASPMTIYALVTIPDTILKRGQSDSSIGETFEDSWARYDAASVSLGASRSAPWWGTSFSDPIWTSTGKEVALEFDTTDAPWGARTVTLNFNIDVLGDSFGTPTLKIYRLAEALSTSHWLAGGTLIHSEELTETGVHSYSLSYADLNVGGITRFKFSFSKLEAQTKPTEVAEQHIHFSGSGTTYAYLVFTR